MNKPKDGGKDGNGKSAKDGTDLGNAKADGGITSGGRTTSTKDGSASAKDGGKEGGGRTQTDGGADGVGI
ncbi:BatC protein [Lacunimicrobium album]